MSETSVVWQTKTCILLWVSSYRSLALYLDANAGFYVLSIRACDPEGYQAFLHQR